MNAPASIMVWSLPDAVLDDRSLLERQFADMVRAGFDGVAPFVRCTRYDWIEPPARAALAWISEQCRERGMACWIVPDPRLVSRRLIGESGGLTLVLFGDSARAAEVPHTAPVEGGRFTVRCLLSPRHVHMLREVAVQFTPVDLAGVYAVRDAGRPIGRRDIVDLTPASYMFYNARDGYVEAFGEAPGLEGWEVAAFFRVRTNHVDFSDGSQMERYGELLGRLAGDGVAPSGVLWDEPGFTCTYGTLPFSPAHRRAYRRVRRSTLELDLWKLAFDAADGSHIPVRTAYYDVVRSSIVRAQQGMRRRARSLWGRGVTIGMHDTWHFESADMCDMNHGSLDLWKGVEAKTAGFVDIGGVEALRDPSSPWYANLAAMNVAAATLGKLSSEGRAYNNLWTVGDDGGEGWQREAMDFCVSSMALFGLRWLAHAYGPAGTIGQEQSFLGSPPLPGYPDHSTWPSFPEWNRRLREHISIVEGRLPRANLLVLFPVETLYAYADPRADAAAREIFELILALLDAGYHPDLLSAEGATDGSWGNEGFVLGNQRYGAVVMPHGRILPPRHERLLRGAGGRLLVAFDRPERNSDGRPVRLPAYRWARTRDDLMAVLGSFPGLRPVAAPDGSWCTVTAVAAGTIVTLAPSRCCSTIAGRVSVQGRSLELPETRSAVRVLFPVRGEPRLC